MAELEKKDSQESNNQKKQGLSETFNWFSRNKNFIQDVGDILSAQEKGPDELNNLKKEYENRLEKTSYKKHFNSLIFIIDYINKEEGNVYVISIIKEFAESSMNAKEQRNELRKELEVNPKQKQVAKKNTDTGKSSSEKVVKTPEKIDNTKLLINYKGQVVSVLTSLEEVISNRDKNTGFVNTLIDDGVQLINNIRGSTVETGKQIYQQTFEQVKSKIIQIEKELLKVDFNDLSPDEKLKYQSIMTSISEIKKMEIGDVGVLNSIIASIKSTPESLESSYYGVVGTGKGVIEGTKDMIVGVLDISKFILKYSGSLVGIDSEYKTEVNNQASKIWDFIQKEGFSGLGDEIYNAIGKEMDTISKLPKNEQSEAIGKLSGKVISLLLLIKGSVVASGKVSEMTDKIGRISKQLEKVSLKGASSAKRTAKLTEFFNVASRTKNTSYAIEVFLNGPAETFIGAAGVKSFSVLFEGLRAKGASIGEFKNLANEIVESSKTHNVNSTSIDDNFDFGNANNTWDNPEIKETSSKILNDTSDMVNGIDIIGEANLGIKYGENNYAISILESAIKREPDKLDYYKKLLEVYIITKDTKKIDEINSIIKSKSSIGENVKIESKSAKATIDSIDNINKNGALKLNELSLETLEQFDSIPRIVEISDGKFISVVKTSTTIDGKSIFTVRYGITNSTAKFPPFEGISTFIVEKNKISFMAPKTRLENSDYSSIQKTLLDKIGSNKQIVDENPLEKVTASSVGTKIEETKSIGDLEILKAGKNNKGQDVFLINVKDVNGKGLSQFEINVYQEGRELVFYLGSMAKNSNTFNMNDLFKFIPKIADLTKAYSNVDLYKIKYLRIDGTGEVGKMKIIQIKPESLNEGFKI